MDRLAKLLFLAIATLTPAAPSGRRHRPKPAVYSLSQLQSLATRFAVAHGLPPTLIHRMISAESSWRPSALKYEAKLGQASVGLMQLLPSTAGMSAAALLKPEANITAGCRYLRFCLTAAGGNLRRALVCSGARSCAPDYTNAPPALIHRALVCYNGGPGCLSYRCPAAEEYARRLS